MAVSYKELNQALNAVISVLDECESSPVSALYLGLGRNPETWEAVKQFLETRNLAIFDADNTVRLTPAGREMAKKINAANGWEKPKL